MLRVATYQGVGPAKSIDDQLQTIKKVLQNADSQGLDIVCFPECFLTGYYSDRREAEKYSFYLSSPLFSEVLSEMSEFRTTAILGFNERSDEHLFNSVAVIERGTVIDIQRKHFLYYNYFTPGTDLDHPFAKKPEYHSHFIARAYENNCWLIAADWVYPNDGVTVCKGHSCIYASNGREIRRSKNDGEQLLVADIPDSHFSAPIKRRVTGSKLLNHQLIDLLSNKAYSIDIGTRMNKTPSFREATSADLTNIVALLQNDELGQLREDTADLAAYDQAFQAILADPNHLILVIENNEELLGCVQVSYLPNLTFKGSWRAQLEGIRISKNHRGKGLGKLLIKEAIAQAKARGCKIVQLTTNSARPEAIAFYESLGFEDSHVGMKLYCNNL